MRIEENMHCKFLEILTTQSAVQGSTAAASQACVRKADRWPQPDSLNQNSWGSQQLFLPGDSGTH